ncbi:hypothetical protein OHA72_49860 [Dactylosporangium sp. NBC_01737]|uniref:hypothetical protein n=1 Tax=Dactylosporangium sp. NBC_01737 TaxID=2975959 RepID=UPI002E0ED282|nr:hypothetical protein OHA72_49860 [Dactylosporangium sp. NBC_01737]
MSNRAPATAAAGAPGGSRLVGMRERARVHGGTVTTGVSGGAFTVTVRLPRSVQ